LQIAQIDKSRATTMSHNYSFSNLSLRLFGRCSVD